MTAQKLGEAVVKSLRERAKAERSAGAKGASVELANAADEVERALEWEAQGDDARALGELS